MKKTLGIIGLLILLPMLVVLGTNLIVAGHAKNLTYYSVEEIPENKVGLLLGTAQYRQGGGENLYFKYRIEAAVKLFNQNKIDFILVSGDNAHLSYNEPRDLKRALIKRGIPAEKIFMDYAGFRTLDSVVRAYKVFGQQAFTIISQKSHNERAIYLARKNGIQAIGYNAEQPSHGFRLYIRELAAKTVAFFDILLKKEPKFLGDPIEIS